MSLRTHRGNGFQALGGVMAACLAMAVGVILAMPASAEPPKSPKPQMQLGEHTNSVNGVAVSPDGKLVVSGSQDKTIRFWDVSSGKRVGIIRHTAGVQAVAFAPDGKSLAIADREGHIVFFDVASRQEIRSLNGEDARAVWLAFSPDGETLVSIGYHAEQVVLWDVAKGAKRGELKHKNAHVFNIAFAPDGQHAATSSSDQMVHFWDLETGKQVAVGKGHDGDVEWVAFAPDGKTVVSAGGNDKTVKLWDAATGKCLETFEGHTEGVRFVTFLGDGKTILSLSLKDAQVKLWEVTSGKEFASFAWFKGLITMPSYNSNLAASPNGQKFFIGSGYTVSVWNLNSWLSKKASSE